VHELADLLGELPSSRQQPLGLGVLMAALNERLPDAYKLLPPVGHSGPGERRRRSLRELVANRRAARTARHTGPPPLGLAERHADRQRRVDLHADQRQAGTVAERWGGGAAHLGYQPQPGRRAPGARRPTGIAAGIRSPKARTLSSLTLGAQSGAMSRRVFISPNLRVRCGIGRGHSRWRRYHPKTTVQPGSRSAFWRG
jgi:hypothetical protein